MLAKSDILHGYILEGTNGPGAAENHYLCTLSSKNFGLTVTKAVQPSADQGRFDLQIDGSTKVANVGDQGSTGAQAVNPGSHTVSETLSSHTDPVYVESIGGDCTQDGTVTLTYDESKSCVITNTRLAGAEQCQLDFEACIEESGRPPAPTPAECLAELHACNARCRRP